MSTVKSMSAIQLIALIETCNKSIGILRENNLPFDSIEKDKASYEKELDSRKDEIAISTIAPAIQAAILNLEGVESMELRVSITVGEDSLVNVSVTPMKAKRSVSKAPASGVSVARSGAKTVVIQGVTFESAAAGLKDLIAKGIVPSGTGAGVSAVLTLKRLEKNAKYPELNGQIVFPTAEEAEGVEEKN